MDAQVFEQIMEECQKKKVVSLCKKLIKKCSIKSGADMENVCHLAYWLYVYDLPELSMKCIEPTHDISFSQNYNVWDFIYKMWGLEIRILREQNEQEKISSIVDTMNSQYLMPTKFDPTVEEREKKETQRRARVNYEDVIRKEQIDKYLQEGNLSWANDWRFIALLGMIGETETGLYPLLNESKMQIEEKITEYIAELVKVK